MRLVSRNVTTTSVSLVVVMVLAAGACGNSTADSVPSADPVPTGTPADAGGDIVPVDPLESLTARLTRPTPVRGEPSGGAPVVTTLQPQRPNGVETVLLVVDQRPGWLQVLLPMRPNGSTGWLPHTDVELLTNPMSITVDRSTYHLTLKRRGEVVLESTVAIGAAENPSVAGRFSITELLETDDANGAYGPFAFGLSGYSEQLTEFAGGDGQLGIHGTNDPVSIGKPVTHGCIRVPNDTIREFVPLVPLGTPVIVA